MAQWDARKRIIEVGDWVIYTSSNVGYLRICEVAEIVNGKLKCFVVRDNKPTQQKQTLNYPQRYIVIKKSELTSFNT